MKPKDKRVPMQPEVQRQLERIRRSKRFKRAEASFCLLSRLVRSALNRRGITERRIGIEVYGRSRDWDPTLDSIVRTGRHNLQRYLAEYYAYEGCNDPVLIEVPEGSAYRITCSYNAKSLAQKAYGTGIETLSAAFLTGGVSVLDYGLFEECWIAGKPLDIEKAFDEALRHEPEHALALLARAEARLTRSLFWREPAGQYLGTVYEDAGEALNLDERLWRARAILAISLASGGFWREAERLVGENMPADASDFWWVMYLLAADRENEAVEVSKARAAARQNDTVAHMVYGFSLYMTRKFDEANATLMHADSVGHGHNWFAIFLRACVCLAQNCPERALGLLDDCADKWFVEGFRVLCYVKVGNTQKAKESTSALLHGSPALYHPPLQKALAKMAMGDTGRETFRWLTGALMLSDPWMTVLRLWPIFDPLRENKKMFDVLLKEVKNRPWVELPDSPSD